MDGQAVINRFIEAVNRHDAEAVAACFAADYRDESPAHPERAFGGRDYVLRNWAEILRAVPDFAADLRLCLADDEVTMNELRFHGRRDDGTRLDLRGVNVFGIRDGEIAWGRIYLEPVEAAGAAIDQVLDELTKGVGKVLPDRGGPGQGI